MMKTVAIAGATGLVGSQALELLLGHQGVDRVIAVGRRPPSLEHQKLTSPLADMQQVESIQEMLPPRVDVGLCALGTTIRRAGSKEAFRAVDVGAVLAFAKACLSRGARRFLVVTSLGANPNSRSFYLRTKGEAEQALSALGFEQLTILRPSFIDDQGAREELRLGERLALPLARAAFSLAGRERRHAPIAASTIAAALLHLSFDGTEEQVRIIESDQLHRLAAA